jgi:hypothetical protein
MKVFEIDVASMDGAASVTAKSTTRVGVRTGDDNHPAAAVSFAIHCIEITG